MPLPFRTHVLCLLLAALPVIAQQPQLASPDIVPGNFVDITAKAGIHFHGTRLAHDKANTCIETMGSASPLFDYDNDGRLDIFFVNGAPSPTPAARAPIPPEAGPDDWNRLYHQKKDGTFEDVTEKAGLQGVGYGMGVAVGDYDNDGFEDLYVTGYGGNRLYHNNGNGTFTDVTGDRVTGDRPRRPDWSTTAAWVDLDNDGLLDLVVLRYMKWDFDDVWCGEHREGYRAYCHPDIFPAIPAARLSQRRQRPLHRGRREDRPRQARQRPRHRHRRLRSRRQDRHRRRQRLHARVPLPQQGQRHV